MNTLLAVIIGAVTVYLAYTLYARRIDRNVIQSDPKRATPATLYMDGVDFMPTNRNILFGYHFKSIADDRARRGDGLEVVAEEDVAVRRHEIDAIHVEGRGGRALRIGLDDAAVDPPGVERVREVHGQRSDDDSQ